MSQRPNILFLMTDQMQGRVLEEGHPCLTPNLDRLLRRGLRFTRAYTPNAVCSPARASLMTGLLPHNHGVLAVTHTVDDDQSCLREGLPHWAQGLEAAGYSTAYFGKWHVERSNRLERFGWQVNGNSQSSMWRARRKALGGEATPSYSLRGGLDQPPGYRESLFYGVSDQKPDSRGMGVSCSLAADFLAEAVGGGRPWCCFVSLTEPHDPFVCGADAYARYDPQAFEAPPNWDDDLAGRPNIYRKAARVWSDYGDREKREAAVCYWASISEIDAQFGRLLDQVEAAGALEDTLVVLTSDHGELLGAHGLYCKNFSAAEEVYHIPLVMAGPGVAQGQVSRARVGLHDLAPTLLEAAGVNPAGMGDARSMQPLLERPDLAGYETGFAEYHGGRMILTQRVLWEGDWKFVFNGFDFDELYDLENDPYELENLVERPEHRARLRRMCALMWEKLEASGDHSLLNSQYPILRVAPFGPEA